MSIKSLSHSSLTDNLFYRSMLVGNTAYVPPTEVVLQEYVVTSAQASVLFNSLNNYAAAGYKHLQLRMTLRNTFFAGNNEIRLEINGDTGTNYSRHYLRGYNNVVAGFASATTSTMRLGYGSSAQNAANQFSGAVIDILDPFENTKYTTFKSFTGQAADQSIVNLASGLWQNTDPLTSIEIYGVDSPSNWDVGSTFTLIGLR